MQAFALCIAALPVLVSASIVNRTIDDQFGDPVTGTQVTYSPPALWTQGSNCTGCAARANASQAFNGTWHDGSSNPAGGDPPLTFSFSFTGTAVYIFNILPRLTSIDLNISLDGTVVDNFDTTQNVSILSQFTYNASIFSMEFLPYGQHTVSVQTVGQGQSTVLFDYAIYTTNTSASDVFPTGPSGPAQPVPTQPAPSPSHKSNTGAIIGGAVGGVVGVAIICLLAFLFFRRRPKPAHTGKSHVTEDFEPKPFSMPRNAPVLPPNETSVHLPSVAYTGPDTAPSSADEALLVNEKQTPTDDDEATAILMRQQLQFFRTQLEALRARSPITPAKRSPSNDTLRSGNNNSTARLTESSSVVSSLAHEIAQLRTELAELRTQQENISSPVPLSGSDDVHREINLLRSEIEELRMQQLDPLPEYTPPPPSRPPPLQLGPLPQR